MKSKKKSFVVGMVERTGIFPLIIVPVCIAISLFMFSYGYRLNPYDGMTWDDYDHGGKAQSITQKCVKRQHQPAAVLPSVTVVINI